MTGWRRGLTWAGRHFRHILVAVYSVWFVFDVWTGAWLSAAIVGGFAVLIASVIIRPGWVEKRVLRRRSEDAVKPLPHMDLDAIFAADLRHLKDLNLTRAEHRAARLQLELALEKEKLKPREPHGGV